MDSTTQRQRRNARVDIITETLRKPVPDAYPANMIVGRFYGDTPGAEPAPWGMEVGMLARLIHAALDGGSEEQAVAEQPVSPLQQAEDAKRARDLGGELGALLEGGRSLESAPWYPAQAGDIIHVHYEQAGTIPPCGETYLVQPGDGGLFRLSLLSHSHTEDSDQPGPFESVATDDPLFELWFEAGAHRLTIVRHGRVVHNGGAR